MTDDRREFVLPERKYHRLEHDTLPFAVEKNVAFVPRLGLCTMCGACEGVCPEDAVTMKLNPRKGIPEPEVETAVCTDCEVCVSVCPGFELDLEGHLTADQRTSARRSPHFGSFYEIFRMRSTDPTFSSNGSSGGMVTATVAHLLDTGRVDGAIVTRMATGGWQQMESYVARTPTELLASQKSKYLPNPLTRVFKEVIRGDIPDERLVFVGLPCHVEALRLAQKAFPVVARKIRYAFSIFCSRVPSLHATKFLLRANGISPDAVRKVDYRSGEHPGHLTAHLGRGADVRVDHLDWTYWGHAFLQFFYPTRCFMCYDKTGEQADISFGDNWQQLGRESLGASSVVGRTTEAVELMHEMERHGRAVITNLLTADELVNGQELIRKRLMGNRFWWMRRLGRQTPVYYNRFDTQPRHLLRAFRLVRHVLMAEHDIPHAMIEPYIRLSYVKSRLRKAVPARIGSAARRIGRLFSIFAVTPVPRPSSAEKRPKIVVIGGFGWRDIGDEAMPRADILRFRSAVDDLDIVMLSPDPDYTEEYHGERSTPDLEGVSWSPESSARERLKCAVRAMLVLSGAAAHRCGLRLGLWPNARSVLDELASADVLFNVGGGNLNSVIPSELYRKCTLYLAAWLIGRPVVISGQTIGPFTRTLDRLAARVALNRVQLITLRDRDVSRERLAAIGVRRPKTLDAGDDALGLPTLTERDADRLLTASVPSEWLEDPAEVTVALNLKASLRLFKGPGRVGELGHEVGLLAQIADRLIDESGAKVLFIPTDFGHGVDDRDLHREVVARLARPERAACVEDELSDVELKSLIGTAGLAIGARYHYCVFAAAEGVPFLGLASGVYQQTKLQGLANLLDLDECFVPLDAEFASFDEVWPYVARVMSDRKRIAAALRERIPSLIERSAYGVNTAVEIIVGHGG